jgi:hypothetical protein
MSTKLFLLLIITHGAYGAHIEEVQAISLRSFISDLGVTPKLIKFPETANYTLHRYPKTMNLAMETLTVGISTISCAIAKVLVKVPDDLPETDYYKYMITAAIISEYTHLMHEKYAKQAYNFSVDTAFKLKHSPEGDALKQCEISVRKKLGYIQKNICSHPEVASRLETFRVAQNKYSDLNTFKNLKNVVRAVFIDADEQLRQETLSKQPEIQLDCSLAEHLAAKKQAKADARGLKEALEYLKTKKMLNLTPLFLNARQAQ